MRESTQPFLAPGETLNQVIGAQTASQWVAALAGLLVFLGPNRYRILAVTSKLRVHFRFFKDIEAADAVLTGR